MAKIAENNQPADNNNSQSQQQNANQQNQQSNQQQNQQNPFGNMLGGLSGLLGFDPMAMINQITAQPGLVSFGRMGSNSGPQPTGNNPFFGGFVVPGAPVNPQSQSSATQSQPAQSASN